MVRYYVVACGRMTGIFDQWENGAKEQVSRQSVAWALPRALAAAGVVLSQKIYIIGGE